MKSKTKWGAVIAGVGGIAAMIGRTIDTGGPIPWGEILPLVLAIVGGVVATFGARDAVDKSAQAAADRIAARLGH